MSKKNIEASQVFSGIKTKDHRQRKKIMSERYFKYMDKNANHIKIKVNAPDWVDRFVKVHGTDKTRSVIEDALRLERYEIDSTWVRDLIVFYKNCHGYLKNKYYNGKMVGKKHD
jgi:hypothetical protein